ncbi:MAG: DUF3426 domain-containing protein [Candidatus Eutrophobiaceae bacterium]
MPLPDAELLEILRPPLHKRSKSPPWLTWLWTSGSLLLVLLLPAQWLWFNRDSLLMHYPAHYPRILDICDQLGCQAFRHHVPKAIHLLRRDLRPHPEHANHLQFHGIAINRLNSPQSWPTLQLILYESQGKVIATGNFPPEAYLPEWSAEYPGMPSQQAVQLELELEGHPGNALNFEIRFL